MQSYSTRVHANTALVMNTTGDLESLYLSLLCSHSVCYMVMAKNTINAYICEQIRCKILGRMEEKHCWLSSGPSSNVQITNNSNNKCYQFLCKTFTKFHQEKPKCALSSIFTRVEQFIVQLKRNARIILGNMMVYFYHRLDTQRMMLRLVGTVVVRRVSHRRRI